jgi:hypothetical protein
VNAEKNEQKLIEKLNELAEIERTHEETRREVFQAWTEARAALIRAGQKPGDFPGLRDHEFELVSRREGLLRDRLTDEPARLKLVQNMNAMNMNSAA